MKKKGIKSIKELLVVFCIFLLTVFGSMLLIKYFSEKQTKEMLVENTQRQLQLLDEKLQSDLQDAQLRIWDLLDDDDFIDYQDNKKLTHTVSESLLLNQEIEKELKSNVSSSTTIGQIDCYWTEDQQHLGTASSEDDIPVDYKTFKKPGWEIINNSELYYSNKAPFSIDRSAYDNYNFIIFAKVQSEYLQELLEAFDKNDYTEAFLLTDDGDWISNNKPSAAVLKQIKGYAGSKKDSYNFAYNKDGKDYQIISERNRLSGLQIVTIVDMHQALRQYRQVNFSSSVLLVIIVTFAIVIAILFYKDFFANLELFIRKIRKVESGDYSVRIVPDKQSPTEFNYVFTRFNDMVVKTEALIQELKQETKLRQNAEFRQLQAQINPHFLYNNLLFIMSMAEVSPDAVISMTDHLSEYYRYMTKQYTQDVTLEQECNLAEHYLTIMSLRKRIQFSIQIPDDLRGQPFMSLIIQPLIENAIKHGIEKRRGANMVQLVIAREDNGYCVQVIDDGKGLTTEEREKLEASMEAAEPENNGSIGVWNVNSRLINKYGSSSKLSFISNEPHGLIVQFWVPMEENHESITG